MADLLSNIPGLDLNKAVEECIRVFNDKIKNMNRLNIVVAGKTGVGKSTLINSIFRENLAETGMGKPVTAHMRKITKEGVPLSIYDTRGFELGKDAQKQVKEEILETVKAGVESKDINNAVHCIWYCINTASNRIEPEEIEWLRDFGKSNRQTSVPVIIVLTQSFSKKKAEEMKRIILDENLDIVQAVPVLAADYEIDDDIIIKSYGLDTLVKIMSEALPDELQDTLQNLQIVDLEAKKYRAQAAVATATAAAIGECIIPIPLADCAVLIPTQVAMIATITAIFGINISKSMLIGFVSSAIGTSGTTFIGKAMFSNFLKLIPGAGSVAGTAVSSATAGMLTTALGEAYIALMTAVWNGEISSDDLATEKGREKFKALFKKRMKLSNKNGKTK